MADDDGSPPAKRHRAPFNPNNVPAWDDFLRSLFYDKKLYFSYERLYDYHPEMLEDEVDDYHLSRRYIQAWLNRQSVYAQHRRFFKDKAIQRRVTKQPFSIVQIDLTEATIPETVEADKDPYRYIFTCIDLFSKKIWARLCRKCTTRTAVGPASSSLTTAQSSRTRP